MPAFKDWAFYVEKPVGYTGADTRVPRTLPQRLSDIVNVQDWGAVGDGLANDEPKIQAAINFAMVYKRGGIVFFPPGTYMLGTTGTLVIGHATLDSPIILVGSSRMGTILSGGGGLHVVSGGGLAYDNIQRIEGLSIRNGNPSLASSCVKVTGNANGEYRPVEIVNCNYTGRCNVDASQANGVWIHGAICSSGVQNALPEDVPPGPLPGTVAIYLGSNCVLTNCRGQSTFDIMVAMSGNGACIYGGVASEVNNTAVKVGWGRDPVTGLGIPVPAFGYTVQDLQTERCDTGIDIYDGTGGTISGAAITGTYGPYNGAAISRLDWATGTVTVTTVNNHNIATNNVGSKTRKVTLISGVPVDWFPGGTFTAMAVTVTGLKTFTYTGVGSAPATNPYTTPGGLWAYAQGYGIRCRKVHETVILGNSANKNQSFEADIDLEYDGDSGASHRNNVIQSLGQAGFTWKMPTTIPSNNAGWKFMQCGLAGPNFHPFGKMHYADLPGAGVAQGLPFEGMEYDIIDGAYSSTTGFGEQVTGGGSGHWKVRYDGSVWRRIG